MELSAGWGCSDWLIRISTKDAGRLDAGMEVCDARDTLWLRQELAVHYNLQYFINTTGTSVSRRLPAYLATQSCPGEVKWEWLRIVIRRASSHSMNLPVGILGVDSAAFSFSCFPQNSQRGNSGEGKVRGVWQCAVKGHLLLLSYRNGCVNNMPYLHHLLSKNFFSPKKLHLKLTADAPAPGHPVLHTEDSIRKSKACGVFLWPGRDIAGIMLRGSGCWHWMESIKVNGRDPSNHVFRQHHSHCTRHTGLKSQPALCEMVSTL